LSLSVLLSALWILLLLAGWLRLGKDLPWAEASAKKAMVLVGATALLARMVPNLLLSAGSAYDVESYRIVADLLLNGQEVYTQTASVNRHPYLPLQMYWMAFGRWSSLALELPFVKVVRLAPIAADVGIALLLFASLRRMGTRAGLQGGLSYALNPIPVLVCAYHGQFDAIAAFFTLLAIYWLKSSPALAGGSLGLGILSKSWPVLALPSLFVGTRGWKNRIVLLGVTLTIPLAGILLYVAIIGGEPKAILERALGYNWGLGVWGYTYALRLLSLAQPGATTLFNWFVRNGRYVTLLGLGLVWFFRARKQQPGDGILTTLVAFLALTHAFSIQYLMWVVPFAILVRDQRWLRRYTYAALAYMFLVYMTLILTDNITRLLPWPQADWFIIIPASIPAWLVTVGWLGTRLLGSSEQEA
jgi:hypothetical protein